MESTNGLNLRDDYPQILGDSTKALIWRQAWLHNMGFPPSSVLLGVLNAFLRFPPWCWMVCPPSRGLVSPRGDKGRQDLGKAGTPSNTGTHVGRQWETETRPREGGHIIQHKDTCGETMRDKGRKDFGKADTPSNTGRHVVRQWETRGDKTSGRWTHHPTQAHMWGDNGRQGETCPGDNQNGGAWWRVQLTVHVIPK